MLVFVRGSSERFHAVKHKAILSGTDFFVKLCLELQALVGLNNSSYVKGQHHVELYFKFRVVLLKCGLKC